MLNAYLILYWLIVVNYVMDISNDVWVIIMQYLTLNDILNLAFTSKSFYALAKSNAIWFRFIFMEHNTLNKIVYNYNLENFPDEFHFKMFVDLDRHYINPKNYLNCVYYDLAKKICLLVEYLRPPYYFSAIRKCVRENYLGYQINFTLIPVDNFNGLGSFDHQVRESYNICEIVTNFKVETSDNVMRIVSMNRFIKPSEIPAGTLRKNYVIIYPETVRVLFVEQFGRFDEM